MEYKLEMGIQVWNCSEKKYISGSRVWSLNSNTTVMKIREITGKARGFFNGTVCPNTAFKEYSKIH